MNLTPKRMMLTGGTAAIAGPLIAGGITTIRMIFIFSELGETGRVGPQPLAEAIGNSLMTTAIGNVFGLIGLVVFLIGLFQWWSQRKLRRHSFTPPSAPADTSTSPPPLPPRRPRAP